MRGFGVGCLVISLCIWVSFRPHFISFLYLILGVGFFVAAISFLSSFFPWFVVALHAHTLTLFEFLGDCHATHIHPILRAFHSVYASHQYLFFLHWLAVRGGRDGVRVRRLRRQLVVSVPGRTLSFAQRILRTAGYSTRTWTHHIKRQWVFSHESLRLGRKGSDAMRERCDG